MALQLQLCQFIININNRIGKYILCGLNFVIYT